MKFALTSGKGIKVYTLSSEEEPNTQDLVLTETSIISSKKDEFYQMEDEFQIDFNGDGIVGKDDKLAAADAIGDFTAQYDYLQNAYYLDSTRYII